ncbi:MAG: hypothetical protein Q7K48_06725 [Fusobacterium sp. JB021]|nr:hypothetical protein [Fusobacterium sp. JB021]MDP0505899.1 hypothetical protein [Fusobacterium sp. JB019]
MGMTTNKRKAILRKIVKKYDEDYQRALEERKKDTFECKMLENYKKVRIEKY